MRIKELKKEFFYIRKSFFEYKKGWKYLYYKYIFAPRILQLEGRLDRSINKPSLAVHVLTCSKDLIMAIWSLASYYQNSDIIGNLFIYNDGSLNKKDKRVLLKFFPQANIIETENFLEKYQNKIAEWPTINSFRKQEKYFLLKKIIDTYFGSRLENNLVIDSDLLWFNRASDLATAMESNKSLMMSNFGSCPVYFKNDNVTDQIYSKFNSGIVLYNKNNFSLNKLSNFLDNIEKSDSRNNHFIEQAGFYFSLENVEMLPEDKYHIKNSLNDKTIVKHYTSPRRPLFYIEGIRQLKNIIIK